MKSISFIFAVFFIWLTSSCQNQDHNFYEFANSEVSFQIYPDSAGILRVVRGEGASFLQVFGTDGKFRGNINFDTAYPFTMTKFNKDSVQISYLVTKDNLKYFLPWFKINKNIPQGIEGFALNYSYIIDHGTLNTFHKNIDHLSIVGKDNSVDLFEKGKLVDKVPLASLFVNIDSFDRFDYERNVLVEYHLKDTALVAKFLREISGIYKIKK